MNLAALEKYLVPHCRCAPFGVKPTKLGRIVLRRVRAVFAALRVAVIGFRDRRSGAAQVDLDPAS
jgi:hypothetical protein